ncbi:hypothetical protein EWB00_001306 [Schistosoma japonicum]|uniref:Uncharacterized protein n=1 Tax=Schistosoma japonicum TaxID=6182 RepID=A0A4Z2DGA7_SCHJA|nr:hypothetical protein EWB00_001306 [Schistosoma japonicum]
MIYLITLIVFFYEQCDACRYLSYNCEETSYDNLVYTYDYSQRLEFENRGVKEQHAASKCLY